jgi:hypothetical protein
MNDETEDNLGERKMPNPIVAARMELTAQIEHVNKVAEKYEGKSQTMVRRSIRYDALTVIFSAASPALTTYVAYEDNLGVYGSAIKLAVILVVAIAVSLPALKRILGVKKQATHSAASAMDLRKAVSQAHAELSRIGEDIKEEKQEKYYQDQTEILKSKVSDVEQKSSKLIFDIMEESHGIAEQESTKVNERENREDG